MENIAVVHSRSTKKNLQNRDGSTGQSFYTSRWDQKTSFQVCGSVYIKTTACHITWSRVSSLITAGLGRPCDDSCPPCSASKTQLVRVNWGRSRHKTQPFWNAQASGGIPTWSGIPLHVFWIPEALLKRSAIASKRAHNSWIPWLSCFYGNPES